MAVPDEATRNGFLIYDLYNSLKYLFEGAVAWGAHRQALLQASAPAEMISSGQIHGVARSPSRHQGAFAMYGSFVEARALYDFFYKTRSDPEPGDSPDDTAYASDFAPKWKPRSSELYSRYMASRRPANKRVFHLVYNRSLHAGGTGPDELKNQVLRFAEDLLSLTEDFAANVDLGFRDVINSALRKALQDADDAAKHYGIANPL